MEHNKDWRTDISDFDSLNDLDPYELLVYLRHMYLVTAKNLMNSWHEDDRRIGHDCSAVAENIQSAIEAVYPNWY